MNTPVVHPFIIMAPKHGLVSHFPHSFIVNMQPSLPPSAVSVLLEHIDSIVPITGRLAVVVKHTMKLVVHRLRRIPGRGYHHFWKGKDILSLSQNGGNKGKSVPSGISGCGPNQTGLLILFILSVASSNGECLGRRTRIDGSTSRSTSWVASFELELDWTTCMNLGCETRATPS